MRVIYKAALAVFKDKKMLQVRTNKESDVFYTLGGKIEEGESDLECLKREVKEEIDCEIEESSIKFLSEFEDVAHGKDALLNVRMYQGKLISDQKNLSEIAKRTIFPWLKKHGYIN